MMMKTASVSDPMTARVSEVTDCRERHTLPPQRRPVVSRSLPFSSTVGAFLTPSMYLPATTMGRSKDRDRGEKEVRNAMPSKVPRHAAKDRFRPVLNQSVTVKSVYDLDLDLDLCVFVFELFSSLFLRLRPSSIHSFAALCTLLSSPLHIPDTPFSLDAAQRLYYARLAPPRRGRPGGACGPRSRTSTERSPGTCPRPFRTLSRQRQRQHQPIQ
jgi:hypothetical protein